MDQEGDDKHDFWINVGSIELKHVGYWFVLFHNFRQILLHNLVLLNLYI